MDRADLLVECVHCGTERDYGRNTECPNCGGSMCDEVEYAE